jgi:predicted cupin superfamily sugar epimerase
MHVVRRFRNGTYRETKRIAGDDVRHFAPCQSLYILPNHDEFGSFHRLSTVKTSSTRYNSR